MSPVLLDHRNLKWIWLSIGLLVFLTFFAGYIFGFEKSNNQWMVKLHPVEMALPNAGASALVMAEAELPEFEAPGASIDVDSVDDTDLIPAAADPDAYSGVVEIAEIKVDVTEPLKPVNKPANKKPVEIKVNSTATINTKPMTAALPYVVPEVAGLIQNQPETVPPSPPSADMTTGTLHIVDDADAVTARYSIQVGMYSSLENAEVKVSQLLRSNLSAYLNAYQNQKDETRYNVRFGYFASFASAQQALNIYQDIFAASGYITSIKR